MSSSGESASGWPSPGSPGPFTPAFACGATFPSGFFAARTGFGAATSVLIWFFNSDCFASGCLMMSALAFVSGFLTGGAALVAGGAAFAAFAAGLGAGFFFIAAPAPLAVAAFACDFAGLALAGAALPCGFLLFLALVFVAI